MIGKLNRLAAVIVFYAISIFNHVQAQHLAWAKGIGGNESATGYSVVTDLSGNVYTAGTFTGTVDFDPGAGVFNLTAAGQEDAFVCRIDANGNFVWAKQVGAATRDYGTGISIDALGYLYYTGTFTNTVDFDPGLGVFNLNSAGNADVFISKLDTAGEFIWAKRIGGGGIDRVYSIATDVSGNVYTTGSFFSTCDFDPGMTTFYLTTVSLADGAFISKLNAAGDFVWAKAIDGGYGDFGKAITVDDSGNVYTTGGFADTVDFDPGPDIYNLIALSGQGIFLSKLNVDGEFVWAKAISGPGSCFGSGITVDLMGNVYATGLFSGTTDFDPGAGVYNLTSAGGVDVFITRLNSDGTFAWAKRIGDVGTDEASAITCSTEGNIYAIGKFMGTVDFDPGASQFNLTSNGGTDIYILKTDTAGNFMWAKALGGIYADRPVSVDTDIYENAYVTGEFAANADFDPGQGVFNIAASGDWNVYVLKLRRCFEDSVAVYNASCNSFTWYGNTYTKGGHYVHIISGSNPKGCDSLKNLYLTIDTLDLSFTQDTRSITLNQSGASYLWYDCYFKKLVPGDTGQYFSPFGPGTYAAIITKGTCSDTTACANLDFSWGTAINNITNKAHVAIFPNPNNGQFIIEVLGIKTTYEITVTDVLGKTILSQKDQSSKSQVDLSGEVNGTYFITVKTETGIINRKVVVFR